MSSEIVPDPSSKAASAIEKVVISGDLSTLSAEDRVYHYKSVCKSMGLNPLSQPFSYVKYNGKLVLYANKNCTDQIRSNRKISIEIVSREKIGDVYIVTAKATDDQGRFDESTGAVGIAGLKGDALGNALMKSESKAKRRVTLSLVGLGLLDESEVATIPHSEKVEIDHETGEILDPTQDAIDLHQDTITCIKTSLAKAKPIPGEGGYEYQSNEDALIAAQAWFELSRKEKRLLWVLPEKGGAFTPSEMLVLKSPGFKVMYDNYLEEASAVEGEVING